MYLSLALTDSLAEVSSKPDSAMNVMVANGNVLDIQHLTSNGRDCNKRR